MHFLLTNDDGVFAKGIRVLAKHIISLGHRVTVVAPDRERSAVGHGITIHDPLRISKVTDFRGVDKAYSVNGTPADCVKLSIENLLVNDRPDMVLSGINKGANLGTDVIYSGTVSAAVEGAILGIPSIAVSLAGFEETFYEDAAMFAVDVATHMQENWLPEDTLLNINVPAVESEKILDVKITKLGQRRYENTFECREDPAGRKYYWMCGNIKEVHNDADTDVVAIQKNYISVTPIHFDLTNYGLIQHVQQWDLSFKRR